MTLRVEKRFLVYSLSSLFCLSYNTMAQSLPIIPDGTLDTKVRIEGNKVFVEGGRIEGTKQFNSFREFSIPPGFEAIFENGSGISDILVRVTGGNISNIDGTLRTLGKTNFWLLNPNGVIFGPSAKINIGGTFNVVAGGNITFADGIEFGVDTNDGIFSKSKPMGINFPGGRPPATVIITNNGHSLEDQSFLGRLSTGRNPDAGLNTKNFNVAANQINLDGGIVTTEGGSINLVAIEKGQLSLNNDGSFNADLVERFGDINLSKKSLLDVSSPDSNQPSGRVQLIGKVIESTEYSVILSQNRASTPGGEILLKATQNINMTGENPRQIRGGIYSEAKGKTEGVGSDISLVAPTILLQNANVRSVTVDSSTGGDIKLEGNNLIVSKRSLIISITTNKGRSGDIKGNFSNNIEIIGGQIESARSLNSGISMSNYGFGNSGKLEITADSIFVINGGSISGTTLPAFAARLINPLLPINGTQNDVVINAERLFIGGIDTIEISRVGLQGEEIIREETAQVDFPASVGTNTTNAIDAGNLFVNVKELRITDGGRLISFSTSSGNAGVIQVNAAKEIQLDKGIIRSSVEPASPTAINFFNLFQVSGEAQSVKLKTVKLTMTNGSEIRLNNLGNNAAGIANINADTIRLENSTITAQTSAGSGQLNINSKDFRTINSQITTSAESTGTGGDININSDIFLANSSSQITATAVQGNGGNISLRGNDGIFISADSIVSADSQSGVDGTVNIEGITSEQIGNELSFYNIRKAEEEQQQPPTTFTSDCVEESLTATSGVNPKYDPYRDPDSPLSGLTPPEQTSEVDNELLKHYATGIIMAKVPQDESLLLDYLREHFEDVRVSPSGVIQTGEIKNLEKIEIPADWFKRSFNYLEICQ